MTCESEMRRVDETLGDVGITWAFPAGTMTKPALGIGPRSGGRIATAPIPTVTCMRWKAMIVLNAGAGGLHLDASSEFDRHVSHLAVYMRCLVAEAPETEKDYMAPVLSAVRAEATCWKTGWAT